jgi:hypothetical protein
MTIHLSEEVYTLLEAKAKQLGKPATQLVQEHLAEWLLRAKSAEVPRTARERSAAVLQAAGLLTELSSEERERAAQCTATLADVRRSLDHSDGPSLSSIVLEMRGKRKEAIGCRQ